MLRAIRRLVEIGLTAKRSMQSARRDTVVRRELVLSSPGRLLPAGAFLSNDILAKAVVTVIVMITFAVLLIFDRPHEDLQPIINPPDILTSHR
jgi:hypothetical protein